MSDSGQGCALDGPGHIESPALFYVSLASHLNSESISCSWGENLVFRAPRQYQTNRLRTKPLLHVPSMNK